MKNKLQRVLCCLISAGMVVSSGTMVMADQAPDAEAANYEITCSKDDIVYENIYFDYAEEIEEQKKK